MNATKQAERDYQWYLRFKAATTELKRACVKQQAYHTKAGAEDIAVLKQRVNEIVAAR